MSGNVKAAPRGAVAGRNSSNGTVGQGGGGGMATQQGPATPVTAAATATITAGAEGADAAAPGEGGPTDAIIEELKALAKSMLDATNAARRRAHTLESRRSYEALMNAIEGRGPGNGSALSVEDVPSPAPRGDRVAGAGWQTMSTATATNPVPSPSGAQEAPSPPQTLPRQVRHADPAAGLAPTRASTITATPAAATPAKPLGVVDAEEVEGDLLDILASLAPPSLAKAAPDAGEGSGSKGFPTRGDASSSSAAAAAAVQQQQQQQQSLRRKGKLTASAERDMSGGLAAEEEAEEEEEEEEERTEEETRPRTGAAGQKPQESSYASPESTTAADEDDTIFDGVRTQVFFKSTDTAAYSDVASSAWKPERLWRNTDGSSFPDDSDGDNHSSSSSSSGSSSASDNDEDDEVNPVGHLGTRNRTVVAKKPKRVYRVPLFPYGGGVTDAEAQELSKKFMQCIRTSSRSSAAANVTPQLITQRAFVDGTYPEIARLAANRHAVFRPQSPYEFVVEVERPVLFDAVHAREHRRRRFRQLMKKGQAPATMGTFNLRVIMDPTKTGFEDEKQFPIVRGSIVADRYQIVQMLGKATFSRAVRCYDLQQPIYDDEEDEDEDAAEVGEEGKRKRKPVGYMEVCLKIINNTKDFFDQSLDEIRLLTLINANKDPDEAHVLRLFDAFYYKEHTMLVTELLSDNLYEYGKYNREEEDEFYFTLPRLRRIARQITEALAYVHSLNLIHADLKPENVLFVSHRRCIVKVIDFGSSCFLSDHLSSYIQSRSYRAPEVVLGCDYDGRIDVWSLGAILTELVTGDVLFTSETVPEMLARIVYICGHPFPRRMLWEGRHTCSFINKFGLIYESSSSKEAASGGDGGGGAKASPDDDSGAEEPYYVYTPVPGYVPPPPSSSSRESKGDKGKSGEPSSSPAKPSTSCGAKSVVTNGREEPYTVLRRKLAAAGQEDEEFFSFVKACLTLDHKKRPTSAELLSHPFLAEREEE